MNHDIASVRRKLVRDVLLLQVKLLLGAARDLALTPVTLTAAAIDFVLAGRHPPRWFYFVMRMGERSENWIDTWSAARGEHEPPRENVETLLLRVEEVVRDPQMGARHARVLKRWAERQVARARQRISAQGANADSEKKP